MKAEELPQAVLDAGVPLYVTTDGEIRSVLNTHPLWPGDSVTRAVALARGVIEPSDTPSEAAHALGLIGEDAIVAICALSGRNPCLPVAGIFNERDRFIDLKGQRLESRTSRSKRLHGELYEMATR